MENALVRDLDHVLEHTAPLWEELRGARIFFTGGTGFVGSWLVESLLWANRRMNVNASAVLLTRNAEAFQARAPHIAGNAAIKLVQGDAGSFEFPAGEFQYVIHATTEPYFAPDAARPTSIFDANITGTRRVLELARARGTKRFLFTSSGAVYGAQPPEITHVSEDYAGAPFTTDTAAVYGHSKRVSELFCAMYAGVYGLHATIARLFAFTGPGLPLDQNYAVGNFIRDVLAGGPVRISGDGTPYRSYLYAADLAAWLWTILLKGQPARPYNVGSPHELTIADLARCVVAATAPGTAIEIARQPQRGVPPARYVPSTARAESELGLRPWISVEEGIRRTYEWHLRASAAAKSV